MLELRQTSRTHLHPVRGLWQGALPFEVSSCHTSGGLAYEQGQRKTCLRTTHRQEGNPTRLSLSAPSSRPRGSSHAKRLLIAIPNRNCLAHLVKQSACREVTTETKRSIGYRNVALSNSWGDKSICKTVNQKFRVRLNHNPLLGFLTTCSKSSSE